MTRTMVMSQILPPLGSVVLPLLAFLGGCGGEAWSTAAPPITGKSPALFTGTLQTVNPSNALERVDLSRRAPGGWPSLATYCLKVGVPTTEVGSQLGHSNPATTLWHWAPCHSAG